MSMIKEEPCSPSNPIQRIQYFSPEGENDDQFDEKMVELVKSRYSDEILRTCEKLKSQNEESFIVEFKMQINVAELLDFNALLGNYLINQPRRFLNSLRWASFILIKEHDWIKLSTSSQIAIVPKIIHFPSFTECKLIQRLPTQEKLIKIFGTVTSLTPVLQYTKCTKYGCSQEECVASKLDDEVFAWLPGDSESSIVRTGLKCSYCNALMQEDVKFRKLGEQCIFKVILNEGIECLRPCNQQLNQRYQAVTVIARDDLVKTMEMGHSYWITGMVVVDASQRSLPQFFTNKLEAFHVEECCSLPIKKVIIADELPSSIRKLYEDRTASPWSFVASLAYCFGDSISIGGAYHRLKLALMLSAVLTGDDVFTEDVDEKVVIGNELQKIHVMAISEDVITVQRLLSYASGFCERSIVNQSCLDLTGNVNQEAIGTPYVDGGSLLLAGRHVCIIHNITSLKKDEIQQLRKALEENAVSIDISKHVGDQAEFSQIIFPLKCTVWAAAESSSNYSEVKQVDFKGLTDDFDLVYDFTNEYKLPVEIEEEQVYERLKKGIGLDEENEIKYDDLKTFLKFARSSNVTFSQSASSLIKDFFLASRRARNIGYSRAEIDKRALQTMMSLAAAHAKLSLHKEVTLDDALIAIMLCEESITMRFGKSVIDLEPKLHFETRHFVENLGPKHDQNMVLLQMKVKAFLRTFSRTKNNFYVAEE